MFVAMMTWGKEEGGRGRLATHTHARSHVSLARTPTFVLASASALLKAAIWSSKAMSECMGMRRIVVPSSATLCRAPADATRTPLAAAAAPPPSSSSVSSSSPPPSLSATARLAASVSRTASSALSSTSASSASVGDVASLAVGAATSAGAISWKAST